ncbi:hypothetical protein B0T19DRAFT_101014 [Cercophora scortea]|uniref:Uncharacterized protein n=1 Tax=Cercophora scortea TaxID=314031 RepID=A0AAE0IXI2_9PEZI|nr:hypothetical protein B0T19DRAFT_101014 [Cercophora scortea]
MLVRDLKRLALIIGPVCALFLISLKLSLWGIPVPRDSSLREQISTFLKKPDISSAWLDAQQDPLRGLQDAQQEAQKPSTEASAASHVSDDTSLMQFPSDASNATHHEVFSVSTADKAYFSIRLGDVPAFNPNIIPHPTREGRWIVVAQRRRVGVNGGPPEPSVFHVELVCDASFVDGVLQCLDQPIILPIAATIGQDKCTGDLLYMGWNVGPHDARVFYGPRKPYTIFGSNSGLTCFGMWMQDFRVLVDWGFDMFNRDDFRLATEVQRPPPYRLVEKNWFVFWDRENEMYAHYDVVPKRSFAKLEPDGFVGPDLAPAAQDAKCLERYSPKLGDANFESIHQATNSLRITTCRHADRSCEPDDSNTFLFTIIQHKTYYDYHSEYEPYAMVFRHRAPFELYGISRKPIWIHGRQRIDDKRTEMFYVVSMSWKTRGQKYHGYMDDVLFLSFGVEDKEPGGIDVLASDLLTGLGLCSET